MRKRSWTEKQLREATKTSRSFRKTIFKIGLRPTGGNYKQVKKYIKEYNIDISHFTGRGWNKGLSGRKMPRIPTKEILKRGTTFQSYKLKNRLFDEGVKKPKCELCGWNKKSVDGRIPVELDHINGDAMDNRLKNLRILCPNCHSLQTTHRALNSRKK